MSDTHDIPILNAIKNDEDIIRRKLDIFNNNNLKDENRGWYSKHITIDENVIINIRLVAHVVDKFRNTNLRVDDMMSVGMIGLIKAVNTFDVQRGTKFATYAVICIQNEILMHLKKERKHDFNSISIEEEIYTNHDGNTITLKENISSENNLIEEQFERKCLIEEVLLAMKTLNNFEREVIEHRFGLNGKDVLTQRELHRRLGVSRSYISKIEKSSKQKMKRILEMKPTTLSKSARRIR